MGKKPGQNYMKGETGSRKEMQMCMYKYVDPS
jgi:hypothetical protein